MSDTPRRIEMLFDTDVWVDFFCDWQGNARVIGRVLEAVERSDGQILCAVTSVHDVYYLVQQVLRLRTPQAQRDTPASIEARRKVAWSCVTFLRKRALIVGADMSDCLEAEVLKSVHGDLGDNLVLAAAKRTRASYLVSQNEALRAHAPLPGISVREAAELMQVSADA